MKSVLMTPTGLFLTGLDIANLVCSAVRCMAYRPTHTTGRCIIREVMVGRSLMPVPSNTTLS